MSTKPTLQPKAWWLQLRQYFIFCLFFIFFLSPTQSHSQFFDPEASDIENSGDAALFLLPASAGATTLLLKDYQGTWQFTKSFALNLAVTGAAKVLINKERPFHGGGHAFPSGHTSIAFQSASFFHRRYGFKYSIPGYVLASFTAYSRLNAAWHDGWDILAGAALGIGSTWFFTTPLKEKQMELTFSSQEDILLLGFNYRF